MIASDAGDLSAKSDDGIPASSPSNPDDLFEKSADCILSAEAPEVPIVADVAYGNEPRQVYDLARPTAPRDGRGKTRGLVVIVHGGGWTSGGKKLFRPLFARLVAHGYAVIATNYRLASGPKSAFPAAVQDLRCAVRHAQKTLGTELPFAYVGASAGGHLAALATVAFDETAFDPAPSCGTASLRPVGTVAYYPPTELDTAPAHYTYLPMVQAVDEFLRHGGREPDGKHPRPRDDQWLFAAKKATPKHFASVGDPPILFLHGTRDTVVPGDDSENLAAALRAVSVPSKVFFFDAGHGFPVFAAPQRSTDSNEVLDAGAPRNTEASRAACLAVSFLDRRFANAGAPAR